MTRGAAYGILTGPHLPESAKYFLHISLVQQRRKTKQSPRSWQPDVNTRENCAERVGAGGCPGSDLKQCFKELLRRTSTSSVRGCRRTGDAHAHTSKLRSGASPVPASRAAPFHVPRHSRTKRRLCQLLSIGDVINVALNQSPCNSRCLSVIPNYRS